MVRDTVIVVTMMAGNQGLFDFVLDTGADTTIVDLSLATQLSLACQGRLQVATLARVQTLTRCSMPALSVGPAQVNNLRDLVQDLAELRKLGARIAGVAGQDFVSHFNYLLDYRKRSVRFEQENKIQNDVEGTRVPIAAGATRMIVDSYAQSVGRAKLRLLLDSGANSIVLIPGASRSLNFPAQTNGIETTSSGQVQLGMGRVRALTIGSQQFHDIAVALAATAPAERTGDGLLPTVLFQSLYFNNRDGLVVLNPRLRKN